MEKPLKGAKGYLFKSSIVDHLFDKGTIKEIYGSTGTPCFSRKIFLITHGDVQYALKTIQCPLSETDEILQAKKEYEIALSLSEGNPHIICPLDMKEDVEGTEASIEILCEYKGVDLTTRIDKAQAAEIVEIARKTLDPLAFLESKGVLHSDVKPGNFLVKDNFYTLIDFGVSRQFTKTQLHKETVTLGDKIIGHTKIYSPPELFNESEQNELNKIDVYCWGMMIYELITKKDITKLVKEVDKYKRSEKDYKKFMQRVAELELPGDKTGNLTAMFMPILLRALAYYPKDRPSFAELYQLLGTTDNENPQTVQPKKEEVERHDSATLIQELITKVTELNSFIAKKEKESALKEASNQSRIEQLQKELLNKSEKILDLELSIKDMKKELIDLRKENYALKNASPDKELQSALKTKDAHVAKLEAELAKFKSVKSDPFKGTGKLATVEEIKPYLTTLVNELIGQVGVSVASKVIDAANNLTKNSDEIISLFGDYIRDTGAQVIALSLRCNNQIQILDLGLCGIGFAGAQALGSAIQYHHSLKALLLGYEAQIKSRRKRTSGQLTEAQLLLTLFTGLRFGNSPSSKASRASIIPSSIMSAKKNWNNITLGGVKAIAEGIRNNDSLIYLDLSFTDIGDPAVFELASALKVNSKLKKLYLYGNENISDMSGKAYGFRPTVKIIGKIY